MIPPVAERVGSEGWTVVDLLDDATIRRAQQVIDSAALDRDHPFYASPAESWGPVAHRIDQELKQLVEPRAHELLPGYRPFLAGVTSKGAGSNRRIAFHQDWTYTDERRWRVVFLWCPLVDVDERNGGLSVVPGSHRWSLDLRPSRSVEPAEDLQSELAALARPVALRAGQAIAFDPASFHGSGPNASDQPRPAFTMAFVPDGAPLVHFHEEPTGAISGYLVDDDFFTRNPYRTRPEGYPSIEPPAPALTARTLAEALSSLGPAAPVGSPASSARLRDRLGLGRLRRRVGPTPEQGDRDA